MKLSFLVFSCMALSAFGQHPYDLRTEYLASPRNIDSAKPRFSWKVEYSGYGFKQSAFQIVVEPAAGGSALWDSGKVPSDASLWIEYAGEPLESNTAYQWKVQVWDQNGKSNGWSALTSFQTALLNPYDWKASWIRVPYDRYASRPGFKEYTRLLEVKNNPAHAWVPEDPLIEPWIAAGIQKQMNGIPDEHAEAFQRDRLEELLPAPMFRRVFEVKPGLRRAVLHYCGLGLAEMSVNGHRIGDHTWDPAFTDYNKRAMYLTANLTEQLSTGTNVLGAIVGDGWYGQSIGFSNVNGSWRYGDPGLIAQLELFYADGTREQVVTDGSWDCTLDGPVVKDGVWCGEFYDAGKEMPGWNTTSFVPDSRWIPAVEVPPLSPVLEAQMIQTIREVETSPVKDLTGPKPGVWVADMGRILTGYCELAIKDQPRGTMVLLTFGQSLNPDGTVSTSPGTSCGSWPEDAYVCKGGDMEVWKPQFTFHAFRYVQIDGLQGTPDKKILSGRFTSTDFPKAGAFECSVPLFNELHHALVRTTQGNARHLFSDTPSRERTGWMTWPNPLSIFDNFDAYHFFRKWIGDAKTGARTAGIGDFITVFTKNNPPFIADSGRQGQLMDNVGGGMAPGPRSSPHPEQRISNVMYPWEVYLRYADIEPLRDHYDIMKNTIDFLAEGRVGGLLPTPIGDWHDAVKSGLKIGIRRERGLERDDTWGSIMGGYPVHTPGRVCGTVHLWLAADALVQIADVLGHPDDAAKYRKLSDELVAAFNRTYLKTADGRYSYTTPAGNTYESQTMYGYALYHHLVPANLREATKQRFLKHIAEYQGHFTSGQLGTDRVLKSLTQSGEEQAAFDILTAKGFPGFDYMLSFGTETTWETWGEAILNNTPKDSKNIIRATRPQEHMEFTAVDSWFFECVLGLTPNAKHPGYKRFTLKPYMYRQMEWARGSYESPYGRIVSDWKCVGNVFEWSVEVPPNTMADLYIPSAGDAVEVVQGSAGLISRTECPDEREHVVVGSGRYRFRSSIERR
ncbi:MAG: glycoside hydrolase family 78 protein [Kiritimatiellales bacterium]|nr:glycoside hydrolase family 78 protein [Kiritimatiellales bacterium]